MKEIVVKMLVGEARKRAVSYVFKVAELAGVWIAAHFLPQLWGG